MAFYGKWLELAAGLPRSRQAHSRFGPVASVAATAGDRPYGQIQKT